ncbi:hypothetical protein LTR10_003937 [Elasticomyces elasticus]|nr:hypothetical protein LTR10_003937 [Elasticomyces elasticus]KAK4977876.1 hypothetical protein LTR42_002251 [Elasticomyces elasticus]
MAPTMTPTILVVGATGNTGRSLVKTRLIRNTNLASHRILAVTRNTDSPAAKEPAKVSGIVLVQQNLGRDR